MKNYYEILGVTTSAAEDEIRRAYRRLAMEYHPDRNPDNPRAEEKFKEIAEAYGVLTDPQKRREYDLYRATGTSSGAGENFRYSQEDILNDLFRDPRFQQMFQGLLREFQRSGLQSNPQFIRRSFSGSRGGLFFNGLLLFGSLAGPAMMKGGSKKKMPQSPSVLKKLGNSVGRLLGMNKTSSSKSDVDGDIVYETPIAAEDLRRGVRTDVVSYDGNKRETLRVTIPAGCRYGQRLRVRGKGRQVAGRRGDLYLKICEKKC